METVLILSADKWNFSDEKTGEIRNGVTLQYVNDYREDSATEVGFKPIKVSANPEIFDTVRKNGAPALYKLDMKTRPGKEGKPTLTIVKVEFVKEVEIFKAA